jgi:hypothetical protein
MAAPASSIAVGDGVSASRLPDSFALRLRLRPDEVLAALEQDRDVDVLAGMPEPDAEMARFIALVREGGFVLRRSPSTLRADDGDDAGQRIELLASVSEAEHGSLLEARFRFQPLRGGYWALGSFAFALAIGTPQALVVTALLFLLVHVPSDLDTRRLELVAKLSDTLGPHLLAEDRPVPYR